MTHVILILAGDDLIFTALAAIVIALRRVAQQWVKR